MTGLLFEKIASIEGLKLGWEKARDNAGASGGDGVTCAAFGVGSGMQLAHLSEGFCAVAA